MLTLSISSLVFPGNSQISEPIVVDLYIKPFYQPDSAYALIAGQVPIDVNGDVLDSPLPSTDIDPSEQYVLKAVNDLCLFVFTQDVILYPYCPAGFTMSSDHSECTMTSIVDATPPTDSQNAVNQTNGNYSLYGTFIYNPGYNSDGTGTSTQIPISNGFWINPTADLTDGPLNRCGIWNASPASDQTIGYSICLTFEEDTTVLVGLGTDNYGIISVDGNDVVTQNPTTLAVQYNTQFPGIGAFVTFRIFHVYPVLIPAGTHVLQAVGYNVSGPAAMGMEVYNISAAALPSIISYAAMGANLLFSSKDFIGQPIQSGNQGIGYGCPDGYSLNACDSPVTCISIITTPVLY